MMLSMKFVSGAAAFLLLAAVIGTVDFTSNVAEVAATDEVNGTSGGGAAFSSRADADGVKRRTHAMIARIQNERRNVLYHSRQLQGECSKLQHSTVLYSTDPVLSVFRCVCVCVCVCTAV
mmetsp:Transcript_24621/g.58405  ORF Transcript_24621/g.58405 Transcript_24621/m.58405 type:complete len:120 (+) Transcript_24621:500-859(+)